MSGISFVHTGSFFFVTFFAAFLGAAFLAALGAAFFVTFLVFFVATKDPFDEVKVFLDNSL
jgi:hypothetical protein